MSDSRTVEDRFWSKVTLGDPRDCWEWNASRNGQGYGWFRLGGRMQLAHRVSWSLSTGLPMPSFPFVVAHSCDNPPCVNPGHLWGGTQEENVGDCARKGRRNQERPRSRGKFKSGQVSR